MQRSGRTWRWWRNIAPLGLMLTFDPSLSAADGAPDAARLANLVRQDCGACHGLTLKGGLGKPLTVDHLSKWDRDQMVHIILEGVPGTPMPGWRLLLTEGEARWIADMLKQGALP